MGEQTAIQWCHHTFNPWRGCAKVSAGCDHCYAESYSVRQPEKFGTWGPCGKRVIAADSTWRQPLLWNRKAQKARERRRVFCGSLCDLFEARPELDVARLRLVALMAETPCLDWLLLTKRPANAARMLPVDVPWPNVWLGVTAENQEMADSRIPPLLKVPAMLRFVSIEPMLGPVWLPQLDQLDWVIVGGESGKDARPMEAEWVRRIRDDCQAAGVPLFFKQWGPKGAGCELDARIWQEVPESPDRPQKRREVNDD